MRINDVSSFLNFSSHLIGRGFEGCLFSNQKGEMCAQAQQAIGETYRKHFEEPVEVQFYRMVTKKRRRKTAA